MNEKLDRALSWGTFVLIFVLLVVAISNRDSGSYDFCVQWGGQFTRGNLVYRCYDFVNHEIDCDWTFQDNDERLVFYEFGNASNIYAAHNCTAHTKVKYDQI